MEEEMLELIWTNHAPIFRYWLTEHREKERYTDATIGCEGKLYAVHKLVLATCSNYFDEVFELTEGKHPVLLLHDVKQFELEAILCYMYTGSANVSQLNLARFMTVAKALQIKGLAVSDGESSVPLTAMENRPIDDGKESLLGGSCWRESEEGTPQSLSDNSESQEVTDDDDMEEEGSRSIKKEDEEEETIIPESEKKEASNLYSFQGFSYKNVEGANDDDLIKKREVLEKIISQTERQFIMDGKRQESAEKSDGSFQPDMAPGMKREIDDKSVVQKKAIKTEKQASPSQSGPSRYFKGNVKGSLNGRKKRGINKLKDSGESSLKAYKSKKSPYRDDYDRIETHELYNPAVKSYKCPQCPTTFSRKYALLRHLQSHEDAEDYACTYCHARFPSKEFLTNHMETHDSSKPHMCTLCQASFSRKDKLTVHMKNHEETHAKNYDGKVFVCSECPDTFEDHSEYVEHSQMHAGERQFPCAVCPAAFAKKVHLSRHVLTHKGFGSRDKFQDCN